MKNSVCRDGDEVDKVTCGEGRCGKCRQSPKDGCRRQVREAGDEEGGRRSKSVHKLEVKHSRNEERDEENKHEPLSVPFVPRSRPKSSTLSHLRFRLHPPDHHLFAVQLPSHTVLLLQLAPFSLRHTLEVREIDAHIRPPKALECM